MNINNKAVKSVFQAGAVIAFSGLMSSCEPLEAPSHGLKQTICIDAIPTTASMTLESSSDDGILTDTAYLTGSGCVQMPYNSNLIKVTATHDGYQNFSKTFDTSSSDGFNFDVHLSAIPAAYLFVPSNIEYSF